MNASLICVDGKRMIHLGVCVVTCIQKNINPQYDTQDFLSMPNQVDNAVLTELVHIIWNRGVV